MSSADTENEISCSSAKKLRLDFENNKNEGDNYYIIMSFPILKSVTSKFKCVLCRENLELVDNEPLRAGFSHQLSIQYQECGNLEMFHSSPVTDNANPNSIARRSMFDIKSGHSLAHYLPNISTLPFFLEDLSSFSKLPVLPFLFSFSHF